jgi:hypothetical protein
MIPQIAIVDVENVASGRVAGPDLRLSDARQTLAGGTDTVVSGERPRGDNFAELHGLLASFGEVERTETSTKGMEGPSFSNGAVFPPSRRTEKRGEPSKRPWFTKCGQEPSLLCKAIGGANLQN